MTEPTNTDCELLYDGACPLCRREIDRLKTLADPSIRFSDIHAVEGRPDLPDQDTLLCTLHLRRSDGTLLTGLAANVEAWQHSRYGWLFRWLLWWPVRPVAEGGYAFWARVRYQRLYGSRA